jgi:hypothetical protein
MHRQRIPFRRIAAIMLIIVIPASFDVRAAAPPAVEKSSRARHAAPPAARPIPNLLRRMIAAEMEERHVHTPPSRRGREPLEKRGIQDEAEIDRSAAAQVESEYPASIFGPLATHEGLATDGLCNDRIPLTCSNCRNQPIAQVEATVAVDGLNILAGWNDNESSCVPHSRQNLGWSTNGGMTFTDGGGIPPVEQGGTLRGDPSHAVNHKTKEFYVAGLYGGAGGSGVAGAKGHFSGGTFTFDRLTAVALAPTNGLYDKPWMTADSLSGNVYFSWTSFPNDTTIEIDFLRCDANLNALAPVQILSDMTGVCNGQFSQIAVGPNGEVYVIWLVYACDPNRYDVPVAVVVRRSDDFGATFGPQVNLGWHQTNIDDGGPGFLRYFASTVPSVTVDCSRGPHRGRVYVAWDESLDYLSTPLLDTTAGFELEPDNTYDTATPFVPGGKLRGTKNGNDFDWFAVSLQAGESFYMTSVINFATQFDSGQVEALPQLFAKDPAGPLRLVSNGAPTIFYTAPRTATYYAALGGTNATTISNYVFYTALIPPALPGSLARDIRDQIVTWSDDGQTWSPPQRVNDSAPGFDGQYPSLAVDGEGRVYCAWMDFRDDTVTGAASSQYVAISGDGGVHWGPNLEVGDAASYWSTAVCQSNGNTQGDYEHIAADGDRVVLGFTDSRLGDPDIFVDASVFSASANGLHDANVAEGVDTTLVVRFSNDGNFARQFEWRIEDSAGWITGATPGLAGSPTLAPAETLIVTAAVHPVGGGSDTSIVRFFHSDPAIPGREDTSAAVLHLDQVTSVPRLRAVAWSLAPPAPNPSRGSTALAFGLPYGANVRLEIFAVDGSRVRTLSKGPMEAGEHSIAWDGRDDRGHSVPAGSYVARLSSAGRNLTRRVVLVR